MADSVFIRDGRVVWRVDLPGGALVADDFLAFYTWNNSPAISVPAQFLLDGDPVYFQKLDIFTLYSPLNSSVTVEFTESPGASQRAGNNLSNLFVNEGRIKVIFGDFSFEIDTAGSDDSEPYVFDIVGITGADELLAALFAAAPADRNVTLELSIPVLTPAPGPVDPVNPVDPVDPNQALPPLPIAPVRPGPTVGEIERMKYRIIPVSNYSGVRPNFEDRVIELDEGRDILSVSSSLPFSIDIFQASSAIVRIGRLTIDLNNNYGIWTPGIKHFANSDRDHRIQAYGNIGDFEIIYWSGFVKKIEITGDAKVRLVCHHELDRLDDILIRGDEDEARLPVSFQSVVSEIEARLPVHLTPIIYESIAKPLHLVFRPSRDISARRFLGQMLVAELLVMDLPPGTAKMTIKPFDWLSMAPAVVITADDAIKFTVMDSKDRMYNVIEYKPHLADDELTYRGRDELYQSPATFIHRYGARELKIGMSHLSAVDALSAAEAWQNAAIRPRRRAKLTIPVPRDQFGIGAGQVVNLKMDHINHSLVPFYGYFQVISLALNLKNETVSIEIREILDYDPTI